MENINISLKSNKIIIEIPVKSIIDECKNTDWLVSHAVAPIKKDKETKDALANYIIDALDEPSIDLGEGYVTPIENMIMDVIQEAYADAEDFFDINENED